MRDDKPATPAGNAVKFVVEYGPILAFPFALSPVFWACRALGLNVWQEIAVIVTFGSAVVWWISLLRRLVPLVDRFVSQRRGRQGAGT